MAPGTIILSSKTRGLTPLAGAPRRWVRLLPGLPAAEPIGSPSPPSHRQFPAMAQKRDYHDAWSTYDEDAIKKAYRKIAPDPRNNSPQRRSREGFADAASSAPLSDGEKRALRPVPANAARRRRWRRYQSAEDIFGVRRHSAAVAAAASSTRFEWPRTRLRGVSLKADLELTLEEVATGTRRRSEPAAPNRAYRSKAALPGTQKKTRVRPARPRPGQRQQGFPSRQTAPPARVQAARSTIPCPKCHGQVVRPAEGRADQPDDPAGIESGHTDITGQGELRRRRRPARRSGGRIARQGARRSRATATTC